MNLKEELEQRWYLNQFTNEDLFELYEKWWQSLYFWVDPQSDSMQIWNFCALMNAFQFMKRWNKLFLLVWWATWMIWNPTWKDQERNFLSEEKIRTNEKCIKDQFAYISKNVEKIVWKKMDFEIVNNYDFFKNMNVLDYLREIWKIMTVNWMMNKEIVRKRISDPDKFISYAEFSYMLLMWYDFYCLYKDKWVKLEVWWSDEWDWIITWIELIWKKTWWTAYWVTNKLILDSNWKKFGKSEWNAIWLDKEKNSPFFVYQYFMNVSDNDIGRYLKLFTFMEFDEIDEVVKQHNAFPEKRFWNKVLWSKVVEIIFWWEYIEQVEKISQILFWDKDNLEIVWKMNENEINALLRETWWTKLGKDTKILDILIVCGLCESKWQWRKLIEQWSIYVNETKVESEDYNFEESKFLRNWIWLLRKWKKTYKLIIK